jgi:NitT/TauT family transport system substrate-binding protein
MSMSARISRRTALQSLAAGAGALTLPAFAQTTTKAIFAYTAVTDFASVFVAREEGYFSKRGLDIEPKLIPLNPSIPPAIQSDSVQLGGPTPSVFLQAVEG